MIWINNLKFLSTSSKISPFCTLPSRVAAHTHTHTHTHGRMHTHTHTHRYIQACTRAGFRYKLLIVLRCLTPGLHFFLSSHWPSFRFLSFMAFLIPSSQFFFCFPRALFCFGIHLKKFRLLYSNKDTPCHFSQHNRCWLKWHSVLYKRSERWSPHQSLQIAEVFFVTLTVHPGTTLGKWPTWCTITLYNMFIIIILYMFQATLCSSSGGQIVLLQHLV